ncbi:MAG: choice-of-anchor J domain-containing protein [Bacteroidales bacterium]|nr:choice-of-anchor J domain-containing protein [Bacteroidales bacterium]
MKKVIRFFAIAAIACGMTMAVSCKDDNEGEGGGNGGNDNGPAVLLDEAFESGIPADWTNIDADGDEYAWEITSDVYGQASGVDGSEAACSRSYVNSLGALTPDNYLVTPELEFAGEYTLTYQVNAQDAEWPEEHYAVMVGTVANGAFTPTATVFEETLTASKAQGAWLSRSISLKDYKGQKLSVAFRHYNCTDMFVMNLDNVKVAK